jgi:DNA modification methylase
VCRNISIIPGGGKLHPAPYFIRGVNMEINKIYCEDNLSTMARMPDNFIDLTVTSPPYDNLRTYNGYSFDFPRIAQELFRVTKPGGVVVWVVGDATINGSESGTSFKQALYFKEIGFNLHDTMIYEKASPVPLNHNRYEQSFEYMFILSKGAPKTFNAIKSPCKWAGAKTKRSFYQSNDQNTPTAEHKSCLVGETKMINNIWVIANRRGGGAVGHPAVFPEQLAHDHIISWSNPGDIVYDPFSGSGTTAKMCVRLNRNYVGSEISEEYCKFSIDRVQKEQDRINFFKEILCKK